MHIINKYVKYLQVCFAWTKEHKWAQFAINAILLCIMIFFVATYLLDDWQEIKNTNININPNAILLTLGLYGINFIILIIAWNMLVRLFSQRISLSQNAIFFSYSHLYKFLPTPAWFLGSRIYLYGKVGLAKRVTLTTTALETLFHIFTGVFLYSLLLIDQQRPITWLFLLSIPLVILVVWNPFWLIKRWFLNANIPTHPPRKVLAILFVSYLLTWIISGPFFLSLISIVTDNIPLSMNESLRIWILGSLIAYVGAYTLGGAGILREFSLTFLLSNFFSPPLALLITIMVRIMMTLGGIFWSLVVFGLINLNIFRVKFIKLL